MDGDGGRSAVVVTRSVGETVDLGFRVGRELAAGDVIALVGPLGAGKTHFVKGAAKGLGVGDARDVTSPTFVLLQCYRGRMPVYHFDAYRLAGPADICGLGCEHLVGGDGVALIEWADRVKDWLPPSYLEVSISVEGEESREFRFESVGMGADSLLSRVRVAVEQFLRGDKCLV